MDNKQLNNVDVFLIFFYDLEVVGYLCLNYSLFKKNYMNKIVYLKVYRLSVLYIWCLCHIYNVQKCAYKKMKFYLGISACLV